MPIFIPLVKIDNLSLGRGKRIDIHSHSIALSCHDNLAIVVGNCCPHRGGDFADGYIHCGKIYCPLHHCSFNLGTRTCSFNKNMKIKTTPSDIRSVIIYVNIKEN